MSLLERNLKALAEHHPCAHQVLAQPAEGDSRVRVVDTVSGFPTAVVDGIFLHSRYDPRRDAAAQVEREIEPETTAVVVLGFGLGYGAEAARERYPGLPLLVVEPDTEIFRAALGARDLGQFLADGRLLLHVGGHPESLPVLLESLPLLKPGFLRLRAAWEKNPDAYRAAEEIVQSWMLRRDINVNTLNRFGRLWVRNLTCNMSAFMEFPGVARLAGIFAGTPALVVAGGPSLDAIAPRLRELGQRLLIVSVNTSLKPCLAAGIEPDFTVVVDPQYWASRYLDWAFLGHGVLVAEPSTHPRVFHRTGDRVFLCSSLFPLGETLEAAVGEKGKLGAGGSVATSAFDLARLVGASPLYTAGLDLGFPGLRTHCRGGYAEELWFSLSDRLAPVEGRSYRSLREIGLFPVRSASGGTTMTDRRMLLYKWWFENQLEMRPEVSSFTLSPESVEIKGMQVAGLDEVMALPVIRPEIDRRMEKVAGIRLARPLRRRAERGMKERIDRLLKDLDVLKKLSERGISLSQGLADAIARRGDRAPCLRALDEIDSSILEVSTRNIAGFLLQSIIHGISGEGDRKTSAEEVVARGLAIYQGIFESAGWQKKMLSRAGARLTEKSGRFS